MSDEGIRRTTDFSAALFSIKAGYRMRNQHWPEEMFVVLQKGYPEGIPINQNTAEATGIKQGTICRFRSYLMLHTVDGSFVPYVATQSDLLSECWEDFPATVNKPPLKFKSPGGHPEDFDI